MADVASVVQKADIPINGSSLKRRREENSESDDESADEPRHFRRVRIRCQRAEKQSTEDKTEFETPVSGDVVIRCICGAQDDLLRLRNKSGHASSARPIRSWLIQCGKCKVWQHRSCVGFGNGKDPL